ncbi:MAG: hypothetical protein ACXWUG_08810 [Polyangiales bacterium]
MDSLSPDDFAKIALALASATDRAEVLASFGLDEERWAALESDFQERLSGGLAAHPETDDGAPPEIELIARAFSSESRDSGEPLPFDLYVEVTRAMQKGDVTHALTNAKLDLPSYLRAHEYWVRRMTREPELTQRFIDQLNRQGSR